MTAAMTQVPVPTANVPTANVGSIKRSASIEHQKHDVGFHQESLGALFTRNDRVVESWSVNNLHSLQVVLGIVDGDRLGDGDVFPVCTHILYQVLKRVFLSLAYTSQSVRHIVRFDLC